MNLIKKIKAHLNKAPFFIKEHWPQYYPQATSYKFLEDPSFTVTLFDHYSKEGNVVPVLTKNGMAHYYLIKRISYAPGSDWGPYSNKQFDLQYHSSKRTSPPLKPQT